MSKNRQPKFYVVWRGVRPGVYLTWEECWHQVKNFPGAAYKAYLSAAEAEQALAAGPPAWSKREVAARTGEQEEKPAPPSRRTMCPSRGPHALPPNPQSDRTDTVLPLPLAVRADAWAVDAACSGNPGQMEYRGVCLRTGQVVFHYGPIYGTNNVGEFLAIVHALALIKGRNLRLAVYSDSRNALLWVRQKKCKTRLARNARTETLFQLIDRAEKWLRENTYDTPLLKWETQLWGEVPADFGRK